MTETLQLPLGYEFNNFEDAEGFPSFETLSKIFKGGITNQSSVVENIIKNIRTMSSNKKFGEKFNPQTLNIEFKQDGSFVAYDRYKYFLQLGYNDIKLVYDSFGTSVHESLNIVLTHELFHLINGDLSNVKSKQAYYIDKYVPWEKLKKIQRQKNYFNMASFILPDSEKVEREEFNLSFREEFDREVMNIALDFVINQKLMISKPFMHPIDFDLPLDLDAHTYYKMLMDMKRKIKEESKNESEPNQDGSDGCNEAEKDPITPENMYDKFKAKEIEIDKYARQVLGEGTNISNPMMDITEKSFENAKLDGTKIGEIIDKYITDLVDFKNNNIGTGSAKQKIKDKKAKIENSPAVKRILKILELNTDSTQDNLEYVGRLDSWSVFNSRKHGASELLYPGKVPGDGYLDAKLKGSATLFVDISGSMHEYMVGLNSMLQTILSKFKCTIVYYDTDVVAVYKNSNSFSVNDSKPYIQSGGGTSFINTYSNYIKSNKFADENKVFVLTDGYDRFDDIPDVIWEIRGFNSKGDLNVSETKKSSVKIN